MVYDAPVPSILETLMALTVRLGNPLKLDLNRNPSQAELMHSVLEGLSIEFAKEEGGLPDSELLNRANHTGTQSADTLTDGTTNRVFTTEEKNKLLEIIVDATKNAADSFLLSRANHTGTQSATTIVETTDRKFMSDTQVTKLSGIATAATANLPNATLLARENHTGVQTAATIADLTEAVQDIVGALFANGAGSTVSYDDANGTITINITQGSPDPEAIRDVIGAAIVGVGVISVSVNDAADTITLSSTATQNSSDAFLLSRANHTGTQSADTLVPGTTNTPFTIANQTKLGGIATGATANSSDAQLRDRSTHTGSQSADTLINGTNNKVFTAADRTKLDGIAQSGGQAYSPQQTLIPDGSGVIAVNAANGLNYLIGPLTAACTLAFPTNLVAGMTLTFSVEIGAGGSLVLDSGYKLPYAIPAVSTAAAGSGDLLTGYWDGTKLKSWYSQDHR